MARIDRFFPAEWRRYAEMLEPAVARQNECSVHDLLRYVANKEAQLWGIVDDDTGLEVGAIVTQITTYASGLRACVVMAAATKDTQISADSWRNVINTIEHFAADNRCDVVRVPGRTGWSRLLRDYKTAYVVLEKRVGGVH